jgi:ribosomal protein S18 acetylase RimI-like enzyme
MSAVTIRPAIPGDDAALAALDQLTWSWVSSPAPPPPPGRPFFHPAGTRPEDVLVAIDEGDVAGYVQLGPATPVASSRHVLMVRGLAVDPARRGRGIGRRLVDVAAVEARARGARRLTLRVLGPNAAARALYEAAGFVVEGVLRDEFHLDGRYIDDVLMARDLTTMSGPPDGPR